MDLLIRYRPLSLFVFAVGGVAWATFLVREAAMLAGVGYYVAVLGLLMFSLTEAFGSLAAKRSEGARFVAQIAVVFLFLFLISYPISILWGR